MKDHDIKITLDARIKQAQRDMNRFRETMSRLGPAGQRAGRTASRGIQSISTQLERLQKLAGAAFAIAGVTQALGGLRRVVDTYTEINARLGLAETKQTAFNRAQSALFRIAQKTRAGLKGTVDLYARITRSTERLKLSQDKRLALTRTINKTLVISGTNAAGTAAAIFQLGQGLQSGALRGEELNSVLEQAPRLAKAIARGMGTTVGKMRALAEQGKLVSKRVLQAILSQAEKIKAEFARMPVTISQAMTQVNNAWMRYIGTTNQALGASQGVVSVLQLIARNLKEIINTLLIMGQIAVAAFVAKMVPAVQAYIAKQLTALATTRAAARQELIAAEARSVAAARALTHARAMVAEAEAAVASATGMRRLTVTATQLVPARTALTRATQAHTAALQAESIAQAKTVRSFRLVRRGAAASAASVGALKKGFGTLSGAASLLFSAFAGWKIGEWLSDNFAGVRRFGIALVSGLLQIKERGVAMFKKMGVMIEYALSSPIDFLRSKLADFIAKVAEFATMIPGIGDKIASGLARISDAIRPETAAEAAYQKKLNQIEKDLADRIARMDDTFTQMFIAAAEDPKPAGSTPAPDVDPVKLGNGGLSKEDIAKQLAAARTELLRATGHTAEAQIRMIKAKYAGLLAALKEKGDEAGVALINELIDVQTAKARFTELQSTAQNILTQIGNREQAIQAEQNAGLLTEQQAREKIVQLHKTSAAELEKMLAKMQAFAAASGDPQAIAAVARLKVKIKQLGQTANETFTRIEGTLKSSFTNAFASIISGTKSAKQAFADMARSIIDSLSQIVAEMAAQQIVTAMFSWFGGTPATTAGTNHTGGIAGIADAGQRRVPLRMFSNAPRFHTGGILAPGEVPIIARRGEGIFTAAQMAALAPVGSGGDVKVEVINNTGSEARTERGTTQGGEQLIRVVLGEVASDVNRGGVVARAMETSYGARRVGR